jgi:hypothetical protein
MNKLTYETIDRLYALFISIMDKGNIPTNITTRQILRKIQPHIEDCQSQWKQEPIISFLKNNMTEKGFITFNNEDSKGQSAFKKLMSTLIDINLPKYNQDTLCVSFGNNDLDSKFADILIELDLLEKKDASN